ncbi:MAG: UrcA family protein [Steroidobacteraceae bacterium]
MNTSNRGHGPKERLAVTGAALVVSALLSSAALADQLPGVHVQAMRVHKERVMDPSSPFPVDEITLSYHVSPMGLDLKTREGAKALEKRVEDAAASACREIGKLYPLSEPDDYECAHISAHAAMPQVEAMVAAAKGGG